MGEIISNNQVVVDDYLDVVTLNKLNEDVFSANIWGFGWKSSASTPQNQYWHAHFCGRKGVRANGACEKELAENDGLKWLCEIWTKLKNDFMEGQVLQRIYANAHTYGLEGAIHRDHREGKKGLTAIIYMHPIWSLSWSGELMLFSNDHSTIINTISPKPGRLVLFNGDIPHVAKSPSRECPFLRISLVFKTVAESEL